jgi:hypothetical protein
MMTVELQQTTEQVFERYLEAWARRDPDAIVAFHTEDSVFTISALGVEAVGREAVRAEFETVFTLWPDVVFHERRRYVSSEVIVLESVMECTLSAPLPVGDVVIEPNGRPAKVDLCDVFHLGGGRVSRKDSYIDVLGYQQELRT